jgi:hypothetical protein
MGCILAGLCSTAQAAEPCDPFGQVATGTISTASQVNACTISANAGDVFDFTLVSTSGTLHPAIQLYSSGGKLISSASSQFCNVSAIEMDTVLIPAAGTYTVWVLDCGDTNTGSYELYMQRINDPTGAVNLPFAQTTAGAINSAAQDNTYTFSADANDEIDFTLVTTKGSLSPKIRLYSPSGTLVSSASAQFCNVSTIEMNTVKLTAPGTYTVLFGDCGDTNSGSYEIYAQRTDNPAKPVSLSFGQTQTGSIGSPGQSNTYTFSANANDVVDFTIVTTSGSLSPKIRLYNPSGTLVSSASAQFCNVSTIEMNTVTLVAAGIYTALVGDCGDANAGAYTIYTQRTNNSSGASNLPFGQTNTGSITSAAGSNTYTFSAKANDVVDFTVVTTSGNLFPKIRLYGPSGALVSSASSQFCNVSAIEMDTVTLTAAGTYTVLIGDCADTNTGNYAIYLQRTNNPAGALYLPYGGQIQTGTIGSAAQSNSYTLAGSAGDVLDFTMVSTKGGLMPKIRLYSPSGVLVSSASSQFCNVATIEMNNVTLTSTGTYTVLVGDCGDTNTGTYNIELQCFGVCPLPVPTAASLSPASVLAGSGGFTLTVNGSNFASGSSVVNWNGSNRTTTYVSTTRLTAAILPSDISTAGKAAVTVFNPAPGGGTSSPALTFTINNPVPTTASLSPTSATAGGSAFTLTVNGTNFVRSSVVNWNGSNRTTTYVSATQLQAAITAADIATYGSASVTVFNPTPGGGTSSPAVTFTINNPVPTAASLLPTSAAPAGSAFTLTVKGTHFVDSSVVQWNGSGRTTTYVSATQLQAAIAAGDIATPGSASVTVFNPAPGGGTASPALTFIINNNPVPATASLSPTGAIAGGSAFTLTVTGSGFIPGSMVNWNGGGRKTTYVSATQLQAGITAADIATYGSGLVTVFNPAPGGGTSSPALTFTINNPVPAAASLSPTTTIAGGSAFTLTVTGTNFVASSVVKWNGGSRKTTYVSATQLQAAITAADIATAGSASVTVFNPAPGGGTSSPALPFTINNPLPTSASLSPTSIIAGGSAFTLTVNGTNFVAGSVVNWNGSGRKATYVSATQLQVAITAADIATAGSASVTVFNPTPGGGTSSPALTFTINNPVPTSAALSPASTIAGGSAFTLTVNGANFVAGSVVNWNGGGRKTTYVSAAQLQAAITAADIAAAGSASVTVFNPTPGGGTSSPALTFTINNPVPTTASLSSTSTIAGGSPFTLTVNGANFVAGSVVNWNGSGRKTAYVSAAQLQAAITAADIATAGSASVTVFNPAPGGGTSSPALTFTINNPVPTTASLSPASAIAGGSAFTLTVNGTNFVKSSAVNWNGSSRKTTYVSGARLQAAITAADIATVGSALVTVFNATPGGGTSSPALTFTISPNPVPTTTSLSPTSAIAGGSAFTLTVNGANFVAGSVVNWNGSSRTTTYVSGAQLQAAITTADIATAGSASVTVFSPTPGGGTSSPALTFTINNPVPAIASLSPTSIIAGGSAFTLTVNGTNFVASSVVNWNGSGRTTTYVSATQLQAAITAADIATAGSASVTVFNPTPGGGTSSPALPFTINNPKPVLTSLSPASIIDGGGAFTLTVTGSNFVKGSVVRWNGSARTTTFVNSTELQASIPPSVDGTVSVTVFNPTPGGGTSGTQTFTVYNPVPVLMSLSPTSVLAGSGSLTLTVNGFNFNEGAVVQWNGSALATTFVNDTQLQATVPANNVAVAGSAIVTVANPAPSVSASNGATFTIN